MHVVCLLCWGLRSAKNTLKNTVNTTLKNTVKNTAKHTLKNTVKIPSHRFVRACAKHQAPLDDQGARLFAQVLQHSLVVDSTTELVQAALEALLSMARVHTATVAQRWGLGFCR